MKSISDTKEKIINDTATANRLIQLRTARKLSQDQVATAIGVSKSTYCRMEKKADFSAEVLKKLLEYYALTYEQFYNTKLPLEKFVSYSPKLLEELKTAIIMYGKPHASESWGDNRDRYQKLKDALDPVLAEKDAQMAIPDFNIDENMAGKTIISFKFDAYAEWLIAQCISEQQKLLKAICG